MILIDEEGYEEGIFETTSQAEEGEDPSIINTYQYTEISSRLEGNIEKLPSFITGGRRIDSEDVMEIWSIGINVVDDNDPLEENISSVGYPVNEGDLYDEQVWGDDGIDARKVTNYHRSGTKLLSVIPSIVTNLTILDYLIILFPMDYVKGTMLPGMNRRLPEGAPYVSEYEFIN